MVQDPVVLGAVQPQDKETVLAPKCLQSKFFKFITT